MTTWCLPPTRGARGTRSRTGRRKTLEVELLRRPSTSRAQKSDLAVELAAAGRFAVKAITDTLGVPRSNVIERVRATHAKREPRTRDED
jgi:hypothetical protein